MTTLYHAGRPGSSLYRTGLIVTGALLCFQSGCGRPSTAPPASDSPALSLEQELAPPGQSALRVATVAFFDDHEQVDVPPVAVAGQPFTVSLTTYGGGCIVEDTTVVDVRGLRADVVPYQRVLTPPPNGACTMELRITRRQQQVVFDQPGVATVRVIGRGESNASLVSVLRTVRVE
jgi:hypothetical protein